MHDMRSSHTCCWRFKSSGTNYAIFWHFADCAFQYNLSN